MPDPSLRQRLGALRDDPTLLGGDPLGLPELGSPQADDGTWHIYGVDGNTLGPSLGTLRAWRQAAASAEVFEITSWGSYVDSSGYPQADIAITDLQGTAGELRDVGVGFEQASTPRDTDAAGTPYARWAHGTSLTISTHGLVNPTSSSAKPLNAAMTAPPTGAVVRIYDLLVATGTTKPAATAANIQGRLYRCMVKVTVGTSPNAATHLAVVDQWVYRASYDPLSQDDPSRVAWILRNTAAESSAEPPNTFAWNNPPADDPERTQPWTYRAYAYHWAKHT